jgi:hypothetical protein
MDIRRDDFDHVKMVDTLQNKTPYRNRYGVFASARQDQMRLASSAALPV